MVDFGSHISTVLSHLHLFFSRNQYRTALISTGQNEFPNSFLDGLDPERPVAVVCAGGYRSSAAASILEARGFRKLLNVTGGTTAYVNAGYKVE